MLLLSGLVGTAVGCSVPDFLPLPPDAGRGDAVSLGDVPDGTDVPTGSDVGEDIPVDTGPQCAAGTVVCGPSACIDPTVDTHNCGRCGHDCTALPHVVGEASRCMGGHCVITGACQPGYLHCSSAEDDGCEVDGRTAQHCGGCNTVCPLDHPYCDLVPVTAGGGDGGISADAGMASDAAMDATAASDGAVPTVYACTDRCSAGMAICGGMTCTDLQSNVASCGRCGNGCPGRANAAPACAAGVCGVACATGFGNCDGDTTNGCETSTGTATANCGACGHVCDVRPRATASCVLGGCVYACVPGSGDCDGDPTNGCEVDLRVDTANCGTCARPCVTGSHATPVCASSACAIRCDTGYADCNGDPRDGCEVTLATDLANCGTCGRACAAGAHSSATCTAGVCALTCSAPNFADCNGFAPDGCETDITSSVGNCGRCGNACPSRVNADLTCTGGTCGFACRSGYANCSGNPADGCNVDLNNDDHNCTACGNVCTVCAVGHCIR